MALGPILMFGWPLVALALFARLPARRAMLATVVAGWLFLPVANFDLPGLPPYSKTLAVCGAAMLAALVFDRDRLRSLRPRPLDVPMIVLCLLPFASSLANGLGAYEASSATFAQLVGWGLPYLLGRFYIVDLVSLADLAWALVLGGLAYAPLCWVEIVLGPELHRWVYGYSVADPETVLRFGGWRPYVFLDHGLEVALWMAAASLSAAWLWRARSAPAGRRKHIGWAAASLTTTTVLLKSVNGWIALLLGASLLLSGARLKTRLPVLILAAAIAIYVALRASGIWSEREVGSQVSMLIRGPALYSMLFRLQNEDVIAYRARRQLLLGWGRAVYMPFNDETNRTAVPDSQWIITFLTSGLVGLLALGGVIPLPPAVFTWRYPPTRWREPEVAPAAAVAVVVLLYAVDCLANAMPNPLYLLGAGGLVSAAAVNPDLAGEPSTRPRCDPARAREAPLPASRWQPTR